MRNDHRVSSLGPLLILTLAATLHAQLLPIPQALIRAGKSLSSGPSMPSGPAPALDDILRDTDTIVRGVVGEPTSYLSDDEMDVYTDYQLRNPVFLYQAVITASKKPDVPTATVTVLGGTITSNGLSFTSKHEALPLLEPGTECVFLLKHVGNHYYVAGMYYGVFRVTGAGLAPLTIKASFAPELRGIPVSQAAEQMVTRTGALRAGRR